MNWQPIEGAPKGQTILGWFPYHGTPAERGSVWVIRWCDDRFANKPRPYFQASGWVWGVRSQRSMQPTHWMPLPEPPASTKEGE